MLKIGKGDKNFVVKITLAGLKVGYIKANRAPMSTPEGLEKCTTKAKFRAKKYTESGAKVVVTNLKYHHPDYGFEVIKK